MDAQRGDCGVEQATGKSVGNVAHCPESVFCDIHGVVMVPGRALQSQGFFSPFISLSASLSRQLRVFVILFESVGGSVNTDVMGET